MAQGGRDPQGPGFWPEAGHPPVQTGNSDHQRSASAGQKIWSYRGRKVLPLSRHHPYQRSHADRQEDRQTGSEELETYHSTGGSQTSGKSTPEYCAVSKHISVIVHSLALTVDPGTFAQKLHEAGLVGRDITERASVIMGLTPAERIYPVIMAISACTELQASALYQFIGILRSFNAVLADVIRGAIDIERQQLSKVTSVSTVTQAEPISENMVADTTNQSSMCLQAGNDSALSGATPPQMATSGGSYMTSGKNTLEYCTISQHVSEVVHSLATTVDPGKFAQKLREAGLVCIDIVEQATVVSRLTPTERIRPVIQAILAQTELQASALYQFISVLRSFNPLLADALSKAIGTTSQSPGCLKTGINSVSNGATLPQTPASVDLPQLHSLPGSPSSGIATDTDVKRQQLSTLNSASAAIWADPITEKADTCTTSQGSMYLQAGTDSALNGVTPPPMATSDDTHHLHSPPRSSSPGIATVNPSTDQEILDTGNVQLTDGAPGTQSQEATAVTSSEAQIGADNGGSQVTSGKSSSEYCTMSKHISDVVYSLTITVDPGTIAQKLQEAGLIGSDITERANVVMGLTQTERIRPVIMAVLAQTELRASVFYQFISVLRYFNPLLADALNKALAAGDLRQPLSSFGLLCHETSIQHPSVRDAGDHHLSQTSSLAVPAQSLPSHSRQYRAIIDAVDHHQELAITETNLQTIQMKFGDLKTFVRKKLENKQTDPKEIYEFIIDLYSCRVTDPNAFVIQVLGPASEATLRTIFLALTKHCLWDYINYHLLASVIGKFAGDDREVKNGLKDYQKDFTGYVLVTKIPMHLDAIKYNPTLPFEAGPNPELLVQLSIKVNAEISEHSLVYVIDLWESLSHHCRLPLPILLLHGFAEGCINITWKIPAILAPHVASKARELEDFCDNNRIQSVVVDGSTIYSAPQAELTPMTAEAQKDDQEDIPSPGGEHGGLAESTEIIKEPDMLPEFLRERLQTILLHRNFNMLYLHMDSRSVLPKLLQNEIIDAEKAELLQFYTHRCAQNVKLFRALYNISFTSEVVLKLCEALNTTAGQETPGKKLLADFRHVLETPPLQCPQYVPGAQPSDLHEVVDEFVLTLHHVVSAFDQMSGALQSLKKILGSLVLPLEDGDVLPLVEPQAYEHSHTIQELFRCLSRYYNPVSIGLLQALTELSGCIEADQKLSEYAKTISSKDHVLCVRQLAAGDKQNDLNAPSANQAISMGHKLAHKASLEKLQSHHPVMFSHFQCGLKLATRITVEIDKQAIFLSDYYDIVLAVCAMFTLPPLALVYSGCSTEPLVIAWHTNKDVSSYVTGNIGCSPAIGQMFAQQKVTGIAFGELLQFKCPSLMEVEYFEACTYGLVGKIPSLLQAGVSVNVTVHGDSGLLQAARRGKIEVVKLLLIAGVNPDQQYAVDGSSPLSLAAQEGHEDVARLLLDAKADPNPENIHGQSPLILASWKGYEGIVQHLLDAGADANYQTEIHGESSLIKASWKGHEGIVQLLVDAGADVNYQREDGMSPLLFAAQEGHEDIARLLLDAKADPNLPGKSPLIMASALGHESIVQLLLDAGADVNYQTEDGMSPLLFVAQEGHEDVARLLLDAKADPNLPQKIQGESPLFKASAAGHEGIIQLLLDAGADANYKREDGMSPLLFAAQEGHEDIARLLLDAKADPNLPQKIQGDSPLIKASAAGHEGIVQLLVDAGADANYKREDGMSPLLFAAQEGHEDIARLLLDAKADPNLPPKIQGESPLIKASAAGHEGIVQLLLDAGADANYKREDGASSLMFAARDGHEGILQLLLKAGANPNLQDKDGMSSLMFAAQNGREGILQLLLKAGANPNLQDKDGDNPLTLASLQGHHRVVEPLLENGADVNRQTKIGATALMQAAFFDHHRVVELLLENGADLNHQAKNGHTALTMAIAEGHQRVVELLRNRADLNPQRRPDILVMMEQLALQMSMQSIPEQQQHHGMATETTRSSQPAELDISVMTEEEQLALALQMSMQGLPEQQYDNIATETAGRSQSAEGNTLFKEGHYQQAVECYTRAMQLDPLNAVLPANRAMALLKQEKCVAAEEDCSTALALDSSYVKAYFRRGCARAKLGKLAEAKEDFEEVVRLDPRNKQAKTEIERIEKVTLDISVMTEEEQLALALQMSIQGLPEQQHDHNVATETAGRSQSAEESLKDERKWEQAIADKEKGNTLFKEGHYQQAVECYTRAMQLDPLNAVLPANRAMALLKQEKCVAAEEDCSTALALDSSYVKAYFRRGCARAKLGKLAEAKEDFEEVVRLDPRNKQAKMEIERIEKVTLDISVVTEEEQLALALQMSIQGLPEQQYDHNVATETAGRSQSAEESLKDERKWEQAITDKEKGNTLFKEGHYQQAVECYTRAMQLDPLNAVLPANRAMALLKQEKYVAAEEDCSTALALDSSYVKAYFRRGCARAKLGKLAEAKEDFEEVVRLGPRNKEAKTEIERIEIVTDGMSLVTAAQRGQDNIVQKLLQKGANPNFQDQDGNTALILASGKGHLRVVQILLENGADLNLKTKGGMTAFGIASLEGHAELCQVLLQCS